MTAVDRTVHMPVAAQPSLDALVALGERAESLGYHRAWLPETWGRDAVTTLTRLASRTDRIGIGTSIVPVYSRSAAILGQTAATLHEASAGRFRLGLGPSGPAVIENWHGADFERPLKYTREYVEVIKQLLTGEVVDYDGDILDLGGFRLRFDPPEPAPPVDAAGMGPKAVELAGRFADGWHAIFLTPAGLRDRLEDLNRGMELGDRPADAVKTTAVVNCCALEDGERARSLLRSHLAFYVGGMGTFYRDALARQGYEETAHTIYDAWQDGNRDEATAAIDDDLLDQLGVAGTPDRVAEQFETFASIDGVDAIAISFPRGADREEIDETLQVLAPDP